MSFGPSYLVTKGYNAEQAGVIIAIMNLLIIVAPLSGWAIDKVGHRCKIWMLCCLLMSLGFLMMAWEISDPVVWLMLIGLAFTVLNSSVNASVALIVEPSIMGTAYGFVGLLFTIGLLVYPFVIGKLVASTSSWYLSQLVFMVTNFVSFIAALLLELMDRKKNLFHRKVKTEEYEVLHSDAEELRSFESDLKSFDSDLDVERQYID
jgi:MFS family permease